MTRELIMKDYFTKRMRNERVNLESYYQTPLFNFICTIVLCTRGLAPPVILFRYFLDRRFFLVVLRFQLQALQLSFALRCR